MSNSYELLKPAWSVGNRSESESDSWEMGYSHELPGMAWLMESLARQQSMVLVVQAVGHRGVGQEVR